MEKLRSGLFILLFFGSVIFSPGQNQNTVALAGQVVDQQTGSGLPLVHLILPEKRLTTVTDEHGYFTLLVPKGKIMLQASHMSYDPVSYDLNLHKDTTLIIRLNRKNVPIDQVSVHGSRIQLLTPETYFHVSDFEVTEDRLYIVGHPKKNSRRNIYCARLDGTTTDTIPVPPTGYLEKDFMDGIWYFDRDSAFLVTHTAQDFEFSETIPAQHYFALIDPLSLLWDDKIYFQSHTPADNCLNTYFQKIGTDSIFLFSTIRDSIIMRLNDWRKKDHFARQISDVAATGAHVSLPSKIRDIAEGLRNTGGSSYITSNFTEPLIYGTGSTSRQDITVQDLAFIKAPILRVHNILIQMDFYNGYIYFFRPSGILIHQVPIDFHIEMGLEGPFRKIFNPMVDQTEEELYAWVQRMDKVDLYKIDLESGQVIRQINLESYKNVHNLRIAGGHLYFLYNELHYPFATRLFRMKLNE